MGTVHGAGNTLSAAASACGPVIGGLLMARGMDAGVVGVVWWAWLCFVSLLALGWSFVLRNSDVEEDEREVVEVEDRLKQARH